MREILSGFHDEYIIYATQIERLAALCLTVFIVLCLFLCFSVSLSFSLSLFFLFSLSSFSLALSGSLPLFYTRSFICSLSRLPSVSLYETCFFQVRVDVVQRQMVDYCLRA